MKLKILLFLVTSLLVSQVSAIDFNEDDYEDLVTLDSSYPSLPSKGCPSTSQFGKDHFANGSRELVNCEGSTNTSLGYNRIYRGGAPNEAGINCLKAMGITAIFDLRTESDIAGKGTEPLWTKNAGLQYFSFPMEAGSPVPAMKACIVARQSSAQCNQQSVLRFIQFVKQYLAQYPNAKIFVHCARGQDRTGLAMGLFRVKVQGCDKASARAEMQAFVFNPYPPLEAVWDNVDNIFP